ncbi:4Fe-4S dicluster domain-containing protein [Christensenella timonensis]|uniref:4Fe-4S dicluster domain-containing protein n=1 Tax=Christensenella timonensis TaxID=1816678 RepID=UPI0009ECEA84|nr:4Fe-4S dicluster domain-containing protein [Christensenella timonensis]
MNIMNFTKTVMRNLFSKPATRNYPAVPRVYPERTRGQISIDIGDCIFCGLCARKCPTDAITVDRAQKNWAIERFGCIQCASCVESCPKKCLHMLTAYPQPAGEKYEDNFAQGVSGAEEAAPQKEQTEEK